MSKHSFYLECVFRPLIYLAKKINNMDELPSRIGELDIRSNRTKEGHSGAVDKWDEFANRNGHPIFKNLTQEYVCGAVLENGSLSNANDPPIRRCLAEFANWMLQRKKGDGSHHRPMGAQQTFSSLKTVLFKKFKPLGYAGDRPDWYTELYHGMLMRSTSGAIARGEKVRKKAVGMPRRVLFECAKHLAQVNTAQSYEERAILTTLYSACGRSGEVATANFAPVKSFSSLPSGSKDGAFNNSVSLRTARW